MRYLIKRSLLLKFEHFFLSEFEKVDSQNDISLFEGRSSALLLNSILCLNNEVLDRSVYIDRNIEFIVGVLEKKTIINTSYSNGLAGLGFCLNYIQKKNLSNFDLEDILTEIDQAVKVSLSEYVERNDFDLLHGALGIGCCFLYRKNSINIIEHLIDELEYSCEKNENEYKWHQYDKYRSKKYVYDFGLAHGNVGILYFLAKTYKHGIKKEKCKNLITGILAFYKNNLQESNKSGSFFPNFKGVDNYDQTEASYSRLAWCYGDLGILYSMNLISKWISDKELENFSEYLLIQTTKRKDYKSTLVKEAAFCHGSSGLAYIYFKMYLKTGNSLFMCTSKYWLKETMAYSNEKNNMSVDYFNVSKKSNANSSSIGLINGLAGVGAILTTIANPTLVDWDEVFFLS